MSIESSPEPKVDGVVGEQFYINEVLICEVESAEELSIHLSAVSEDNKRRLAFLMKSGLERLAEMLEREARLKKTKRITVTSWIITEHSNLFRKAGFTLDNQGINYIRDIERYKSNLENIPPEKRGVEPERAIISREELVKRYRRSPFILKNLKEERYY